MVESIIFIGAIIAGVTEFLRNTVDEVNGGVTVLVAAFVGLLVALIDVHIGVADVTVAQGIMTGLATAGIVGTAKKIG